MTLQVEGPENLKASVPPRPGRLDRRAWLLPAGSPASKTLKRTERL